MKRMILAGMMGALAALSACSSTTNSAAAPGAPADGSACTAASVTVCSADAKATLSCNTATSKYVSTTCATSTTCQVVAGVAVCKGATTADTVSSGDTLSSTDTATNKDTAAPKDTAAKDIATAPVKCAMSDSTCIGLCQQDNCAAQVTACQGDADCSSFINCLGKCGQGVSPPADVTGATCEEKCTTLAPVAAQNMLSTADNCIQLQCIQCNAKDTDYQNCVAGCAQAKCADSLSACKAAPGCLTVITCMGKCAATDQTCLNACVNAAAAPDKSLFMTLNTCFSGAQTACQ